MSADDFQARLAKLEDDWRDRLADCPPEKRAETREAYWSAKVLLEREFLEREFYDPPAPVPHGWEGVRLKKPIAELQDFLDWLDEQRRYIETLTSITGLDLGFPERAALADAEIAERNSYRLLESLRLSGFPRALETAATLDTATRRLGALRDWAFNLLANDIGNLKPAKGKKKRGRRPVSKEQDDADRKMHEEWSRAKAAGTSQIDFCSDKDIKVNDLRRILDRVGKRAKRKKS